MVEIWRAFVEEIMKGLNHFKDPNFVRNVYMIVFIICAYLVWTCPCYDETVRQRRRTEKKEKRELARLLAKKARKNELKGNRDLLNYHLKQVYFEERNRAEKKAVGAIYHV